MNFNFEYIKDDDQKEYRAFASSLLKTLARQMPQEIWHYTTADGLIAILKTKQLWSTHTSCLNDSLEQRYFNSLVLAATRVKRAANTNPQLNGLLRIAEEALSQAEFSATWHFATCFSEAQDDLGQWRGYGGGECGYAIGFHVPSLLTALAARPPSLLVPMCYDATTHKKIVDDVLQAAERYYLAGLTRNPKDPDKWASELVIAFAYELDVISSILKHHSFASEREWRIVAIIKDTELGLLEFRQKRTLLARHLPLDWTIEWKGQRRLPITRVCVGPGPSQKVSQVSVNALLRKYGYDDIQAELSAVPYRVP